MTNQQTPLKSHKIYSWEDVKKIAFVSDAAYPWHIGGLEAIELTEARELAKHHEVHFFCMRWPGMERSFVKDGIHYHAAVPISRETFYRHGRRSIRGSIAFALSVFRIFLHGRFDVIEANMFPVLHLPVIKAYCKLTGCKLIIDVVEAWRRSYWTEYLGPVLGRLAYIYASLVLGTGDAYIANSSITAHGLLREGIEKERIRVFAPVLDDTEFRGLRRKAGSRQRRIVLTSRMIKEKRLDKWLDMIAETRKIFPKTRALLIGGGPELPRIRRRIAQLGLGRTVELRPFYENKMDALREVADSYVFLLMSEREGLSISTLESIGLGLPVVIPDYSPIPGEVKSMCLVETEDEIPHRLAEILKSGDPGKYISNRDNLLMFEISKTKKFYEELFRDLKKRYDK